MRHLNFGNYKTIVKCETKKCSGALSVNGHGENFASFTEINNALSEAGWDTRKENHRQHDYCSQCKVKPSLLVGL